MGLNSVSDDLEEFEERFECVVGYEIFETIEQEDGVFGFLKEVA